MFKIITALSAMAAMTAMATEDTADSAKAAMEAPGCTGGTTLNLTPVGTVFKRAKLFAPKTG